MIKYDDITRRVVDIIDLKPIINEDMGFSFLLELPRLEVRTSEEHLV